MPVAEAPPKTQGGQVMEHSSRLQRNRPPTVEDFVEAWNLLMQLSADPTDKEITEALGISRSTVNTHVRRVDAKLHGHSRAQAVAKLTDMPGRR